MKALLHVLVVVTATQALRPYRVTCSETSMMFQAEPKDFPRYHHTEIKLGKCPLGPDFSVEADFAACGLTKVTVGDVIKISAPLVASPSAGVITRRRPVNFVVECIYLRTVSKTAVAPVKPELDDIVGDVSQKGQSIDLHLNVLDGAGNVLKSGRSLLVEVGSVIHAEVGGANLMKLGLKAYATDCFVTPTEDADHPTRWSLLKDSCVEDDTFTISETSSGHRMSFEAFAFTSDSGTSLYLHCNLVACLPDAACGICNARKRRSPHSGKTVVKKRSFLRFVIY